MRTIITRSLNNNLTKVWNQIVWTLIIKSPKSNGDHCFYSNRYGTDIYFVGIDLKY